LVIFKPKGGNKHARLVLMDFNPKGLNAYPSQVEEFDAYWDPLSLAPRYEDALIYPKSYLTPIFSTYAHFITIFDLANELQIRWSMTFWKGAQVY